ncbi:hypothetical protein OXX80_006901 [Metschnikowia pulcherrima]
MSTDDIHNKPKRKKIFWACNHCNKAHITCDNNRPCSRCIKKGLQDTCEDAPRKRKKYLADVPGPLIQATSEPPQNQQESLFDMDASQSVKTEARPGLAPLVFEATNFQQSSSLPNYLLQRAAPMSSSSSVNESAQRASPSLFVRQHNGSFYGAPESQEGRDMFDSRPSNNQLQQAEFQQSKTGHQGLRNGQIHSFVPQENNSPQQVMRQQSDSSRIHPPPQPGSTVPDNKKPNFLSSAADMEYATLSSILQDNFLGLGSLTSNEGTPASNLSPAISPHGYEFQKMSPSALATTPYNASDFRNTIQSQEPKYGNSQFQQRPYETSSEFPPFDAKINQYLLGNTTHYADVTFPDVSEAMDYLRQNDPAQYYARSSKSSLSLTMGFPQKFDDSRNLLFKDPEEIYVKIKKPFSYTPGFHKLIAYLRGRFPREMLVKMAESMAVYRPSFIACTNSLRESDLIFMEQCFQRTLLTYDNFIKVSGTPTIVWRRTGEIAYVGHEFTTLTGWTSEHLLGGKPTFIVELLDDKSVVEYFQLFSKIAFGDFLGATMTECTLLTPKPNVKIRAGCSWTMKRDVFGIPMMIIGNFLPIL